MFGSNCYITLTNPQITGESIPAETFTNGGGQVGHAFLYIPSKQYAVHVSIEDCCGDSNKISEADFIKKLRELGILLSSGKSVAIEKGLVDVLTSESENEGNFTGLDEIRSRYDGRGTTYWFALQKLEENYFQVSCDK